jgi:hypothetical protein
MVDEVLDKRGKKKISLLIEQKIKIKRERSDIVSNKIIAQIF